MTTLPITDMPEEEMKKYNKDWEEMIIDAYLSLLPRVRTLEEESISLAKEEGRVLANARVLGILEEMLVMRWLENDYSKWKTFALQEAITRISNQP